jgi:hypothetical protein
VVADRREKDWPRIGITHLIGADPTQDLGWGGHLAPCRPVYHRQLVFAPILAAR